MSSSNQHFRKSNKHSSDQDFDFDQYLDEKGEKTEFTENQDPDASKEGSALKHGILIVAVILSGLLWFYEWSPKSVYLAFFGDGTEQIETVMPNVLEIPPLGVNIRNVDVQTDIAIENPGSIVEYLLELRNQGLLDNKISSFEARQVYDAGVPISYLLELDQYGFLNRFSFVEIGEFNKNQIPNDYLYQMDQNGYLDRLSFVEVGEFYKNNVSFEYLDRLDETGYLDELSFVHISEYYKNGVTPQFLDELKQSGLYNDLSFIDVVEIYKSQN